MKATFSILGAAIALSACSGGPGSPSLPATNALAVRLAQADEKAMTSDGVTVSGIYKLYGCQIYGNTGKPDPIVNADITNATVDPNSASLISLVKNETVSGGDDAGLYYPNVTSDTSHEVVPSPTGSHNPVIFKNPYGTTFEFMGGSFWIEDPSIKAGHDHTGGGDGHIIVLNNTISGCYQYQMYGGHWGSSLSGYDGVVGPLNIPYANEFPYMDDNITAAGIPLIGFTDFGPDLLSRNIKHPVEFIMPTTHVVAYGSSIQGVNYATGIGADGACNPNNNADPDNCFVYGDILRLKSTYACPTDPASAAVCKQLKKRGMVLSDTGEEGNLRMGLDDNGVDDSGSYLFPWLSGLAFSNFDVITRGAITVGGSPKTRSQGNATK